MSKQLSMFNVPLFCVYVVHDTMNMWEGRVAALHLHEVVCVLELCG